MQKVIAPNALLHPIRCYRNPATVNLIAA